MTAPASVTVAVSGGTSTPCTLDLTLSYSPQILTLGFNLASLSPQTFNAWLVGTVGTSLNFVNLWSIPLPSIEPAESFAFHLPVPPAGVIGILATLETAPGGILCSVWKTIDTGGSAASIQSLKNIQELEKLMSDPNPIIRSHSLEAFRKTVGFGGGMDVSLDIAHSLKKSFC
jgi:hypothetical protein